MTKKRRVQQWKAMRELAIEDLHEFIRRALTKPRQISDTDLKEGLEGLESHKWPGFNELVNQVSFGSREWVEEQRGRLEVPENFQREYEATLIDHVQGSTKRLTAIARQEITRPMIIESTPNGAANPWKGAMPSTNPSGQNLTYEMLVQAAESLRRPMRQPAGEWNGGIASLEAQFIDIRQEPVPLMPLSPKKGATIVDLALSHLSIRVNSMGVSIDEAWRYTTEALKVATMETWKRTQPLNCEIVKSAALTLYSHLLPVRVVFVKSPTEMMKFLHTRPVTRTFPMNAWRSGFGIGMRQAPDSAFRELIDMGQDVKYAMTYTNRDEPMSMFCHAWRFLLPNVNTWGGGININMPSNVHGTLVIMDYPRAIKLDNQERAHCEDGPAVSYADGTNIYAWHGIKLESKHINRQYGYKDILNEPNAEVRRAMVELYGTEKYLADSGAVCVQSDAVGKLWVAPADPLAAQTTDPRFGGFNRAIEEARVRAVWRSAGQEPPPRPVVISIGGRVRRSNSIVFVEVLNSTPEPDGQIKTYWLRVPPDTPTARAGIAWTFGLKEDEYYPEIQT